MSVTSMYSKSFRSPPVSRQKKPASPARTRRETLTVSRRQPMPQPVMITVLPAAPAPRGSWWWLERTSRHRQLHRANKRLAAAERWHGYFQLDLETGPPDYLGEVLINFEARDYETRADYLRRRMRPLAQVISKLKQWIAGQRRTHKGQELSGLFGTRTRSARTVHVILNGRCHLLPSPDKRKCCTDGEPQLRGGVTDKACTDKPLFPMLPGLTLEDQWEDLGLELVIRGRAVRKGQDTSKGCRREKTARLRNARVAKAVQVGKPGSESFLRPKHARRDQFISAKLDHQAADAFVQRQVTDEVFAEIAEERRWCKENGVNYDALNPAAYRVERIDLDDWRPVPKKIRVRMTDAELEAHYADETEA